MMPAYCAHSPKANGRLLGPAILLCVSPDDGG
jgi:hypothetical protein